MFNNSQTYFINLFCLNSMIINQYNIKWIKEFNINGIIQINIHSKLSHLNKNN